MKPNDDNSKADKMREILLRGEKNAKAAYEGREANKQWLAEQRCSFAVFAPKGNETHVRSYLITEMHVVVPVRVMTAHEKGAVAIFTRDGKLVPGDVDPGEDTGAHLRPAQDVQLRYYLDHEEAKREAVRLSQSCAAGCAAWAVMTTCCVAGSGMEDHEVAYKGLQKGKADEDLL